jgi:hypothetical protein
MKMRKRKRKRKIKLGWVGLGRGLREKKFCDSQYCSSHDLTKNILVVI